MCIQVLEVHSCTVQQFSLLLCRLVEGGLQLYCTAVQFIIMQVGGGEITVVLYISSKFINNCSLVEGGGTGGTAELTIINSCTVYLLKFGGG